MAPLQDLEHYLHEHIPLSRAMQVHVLAASADGITLGAPLAPNINHRETVFGGSASALAILAAWALVHTRLRAEGIACRLVIQRNSMTYDRPIPGAFTATAALAQPGDWPRFLRMLQRKGRARIAVQASLHIEGETAGRFEGEFVALGAGEAQGTPENRLSGG